MHAGAREQGGASDVPTTPVFAIMGAGNSGFGLAAMKTWACPAAGVATNSKIATNGAAICWRHISFLSVVRALDDQVYGNQTLR